MSWDPEGNDHLKMGVSLLVDKLFFLELNKDVRFSFECSHLAASICKKVYHKITDLP